MSYLIFLFILLLVFLISRSRRLSQLWVLFILLLMLWQVGIEGFVVILFFFIFLKFSKVFVSYPYQRMKDKAIKSVYEELDEICRLGGGQVKKEDGVITAECEHYKGHSFDISLEFTGTTQLPGSNPINVPRYNPLIKINLPHKKSMGGGTTLIFRKTYPRAVRKRPDFNIPDLNIYRIGDKVFDKKLLVKTTNLSQAQNFLTPNVIDPIREKILETTNLIILKITEKEVEYYEETLFTFYSISGDYVTHMLDFLIKIT